MGKRKRHYRSTIERARLIAELTQQHYEPGNNAKCYKQGWRNVVRKVYPMSYRTFLNYLGVPPEREEPEEDPRQLKLF